MKYESLRKNEIKKLTLFFLQNKQGNAMRFNNRDDLL